MSPLQTTDIETKLHIRRGLKSFNEKNTISKEDLVFLEDEIESIEKNRSCSAPVALVAKEPEDLEPNKSHGNQCVIDNKSQPTLTEQLDIKLSEIIKDVMRQTNNIDTVCQIAKEILISMEKLDKFDSVKKNLPGHARHFQQFCMKVVKKYTTEQIIPIVPATFRSYMKGNMTNHGVLCRFQSGKLSSSQGKGVESFWDDIYSKLITFKETPKF